MNEELTKKLIEWVEQLKNFAVTEIPPFAQEIAAFGFYSNLAGAIFFLILSGISVGLAFWFAEKIKKQGPYDSWESGVVAMSVLSAMLLIPFGFVTVNCIKAKVAPKLYVIERFIG